MSKHKRHQDEGKGKGKEDEESTGLKGNAKAKWA
jgi:hypothetical protein